MKKALPIGNDDFTEIRENCFYYVDKTLMIRDFLRMKDKVALIARPRRFGKTLNMTMIRDFFDITKESESLFSGLAIMDTEYAEQMNSRPVIFLTFKDCKGITSREMFSLLKKELYNEYLRYEEILRNSWDTLNPYKKQDFYQMIDILRDDTSTYIQFVTALKDLTSVVKSHYKVAPILLIDEYDQPIISSYEYGYHGETATFFANFFGTALKGNPFLEQALLTGIQRVAKESIFSQLNNPQIYTVIDQDYAPYFGLNTEEVSELLDYCGLELTEEVKKMYDGYHIGGIEMYNPWSILNYAKRGRLENYWIKTSTNFLIRKAMSDADKNFWDSFDLLANGSEATVWLTLDTSYIERESNYSLWGLLVNAGYITVTAWIDGNSAVVKIPNDEVMSEFQVLITEISGINGQDLIRMFSCLMNKDMANFFMIYQDIVMSCTSYMDGKENAYHMLFLGMCITLRGTYKVTSNIEAGYGRSDITLIPLSANHVNVIVEFKQGENLEQLKKEALEQILEQKYYSGLKGEVVCVGLAHNKKRCDMAFKTIYM